MSEISRWDKLPLPILARIFSLLPINDRRRAAFTCKPWAAALDSPATWETVCCIFFSSDLVRTPNSPWCSNLCAIKIVSHCANWIQNLQIIWAPDDAEEVGDEHCPSSKLTSFFLSLLENKKVPQLSALTLICDGYLYIPDTENLDFLVLVTARFLRTQKFLVDFKLQWQLNALGCSLLLDALAPQCCNTLQQLDLTNCLHSELQRRAETLNKYVIPFTKLSKLTLLYEDLGSDLLLSVANNCKRTLKYIVIKCLGIFDSIVPKNYKSFCNTWTKMRCQNPELKVDFVLETETWDLQFANNVVPSETPLAKLHLSILQPVFDCTDYFKCFSETLEEVTLEVSDYYRCLVPSLQMLLRDKDEKLSSSVVQLVVSCPKLKALDIRANVSPSIVEELLALRNCGVTALQKLLVSFHLLTTEELSHLLVLKLQYRKLFETGRIFCSFQLETLWK